MAKVAVNVSGVGGANTGKDFATIKRFFNVASFHTKNIH
jgi:hypothetical protein